MMKKAYEYREHAEECRKLADGLKDGPQKEQLLDMAENWESLAKDRDDFIGRHPELAKKMEAGELERYRR